MHTAAGLLRARRGRTHLQGEERAGICGPCVSQSPMLLALCTLISPQDPPYSRAPLQLHPSRIPPLAPTLQYSWNHPGGSATCAKHRPCAICASCLGVATNRSARTWLSSDDTAACSASDRSACPSVMTPTLCSAMATQGRLTCRHSAHPRGKCPGAQAATYYCMACCARCRPRPRCTAGEELLLYRLQLGA